MASIITNKETGNRMIQFIFGQKRKTVWLGNIRRQSAETWKSHIEELVNAINEGRAPYNETSAWVGRLKDNKHKKLSNVGLVPERIAPNTQHATLGGFLDGYVAKRSDVKGSTRTVYGHTNRCLVAFFGADKPLSDITVADVKSFRRWLAMRKEEGGQQLADNTVRRRTGIARQFFTEAVDARIIEENPFSKIKGVSVRPNRSRDYFVSREEIEKIIAACPTIEWKLIACLSRFLGLRIPSELNNLKWGDIDFESRKITLMRLRRPIMVRSTRLV